jgi:ABC-type transport system involved in Fe-S cluster assembly fused permease/ATPase subunit
MCFLGIVFSNPTFHFYFYQWGISKACQAYFPVSSLSTAKSNFCRLSECAVRAALDDLMKDRTTLCIAQSLSMTLHADVIVVSRVT